MALNGWGMLLPVPSENGLPLLLSSTHIRTSVEDKSCHSATKFCTINKMIFRECNDISVVCVGIPCRSHPSLGFNPQLVPLQCVSDLGFNP